MPASESEVSTAPVAVVTGGNRGIGGGISFGLLDDGYDLIVVYRRDRNAAEEISAAAAARGRRCVLVEGSIAEDGVATAVADRARAEFGRVDALVHAAGIVSSGHDVAETATAELIRVLGVHIVGAFAMTRELLPLLRAGQASSVVFISSAVTATMRATGAPYNIGKAGMEALALTLANEERRHGIRVNIVSPGLVDTELGRRFVRAAHGVGIEDLAPELPFGRVCTPTDIANAVRWLISPRADLVSGQNIRINGGDDSVASAGPTGDRRRAKQ